MNAYAPDKILAHLPVIELLRHGKQPNPVHVQLVLSDLCNQDCGFCAYRMSGYTSNQLFGIQLPNGAVNNNPNRMIPREKALEIVDDCARMGVKAIQFTGGGEPTVCPYFTEIASAALDAGIEIALVTNGVRLTGAILECVARAVWCRISVDAGCSETYSGIRKVSLGTYDRVLANISRLVWLRNSIESRIHVGVGFVLTADNWGEVVDAAKTAKNLGVDSFRISAAFQTEGVDYFATFLDAALDACATAELLSDDNFTVANMLADRVNDLADGAPNYSRCAYQHVTTYIGGDQNVYRCCNTAYNARGLIGSIEFQSFRELWESRSKTTDFAAFDARGCARCQFNGKNRAINQLVDLEVDHPNFP